MRKGISGVLAAAALWLPHAQAESPLGTSNIPGTRGGGGDS